MSPASPIPATKRRYRCAACRTVRAYPPPFSARLAEAGINVDMIVQNVSGDGKFTDMTFTLPTGDVDKAVLALEKVKDEVGYDAVQSETGLVKVSVIGIGMRSHAGVAAIAFKALAEKGINIRAITTSEIKISILIDGPYCELAVRTLHDVYGLDKL
jgi:aspartate kinase